MCEEKLRNLRRGWRSCTRGATSGSNVRSLESNPGSFIAEDISITFRPVHAGDVRLLYSWFTQEHVRCWWPMPQELPAFERTFFDALQNSSRRLYVFPFIALLNDVPFGYIQLYDLAQVPDFNGHDPITIFGPDCHGLWGIDFFIGDAGHLGCGYGTAMLQQFFHDQLVPRAPRAVIADPCVGNERAVYCLRKLGFEPVAELVSPLGLLVVMQLAGTKLIAQSEHVH